MPNVDSHVPYSPDTILLDSADPADVDKLNDVLQDHDSARPLGQAGRTAAGRLVVPVTGADPAAVLRTLRTAEPSLAEKVGLDAVYHNGTYRLGGTGSGQAFPVAPLEVVEEQPVPPWSPLPANLRRPVVALLDAGVRPHAWFPETPEDDPFLLHAESAPVPWVSPVTEPGPAEHATFLAGLIRIAAPSARVLSVPVMSGAGTVTESTLAAALEWLITYRDGRPLDVVCMAFGRRPADPADEPVLREIEARLRELSDAGVALVASAGNDHRADPVYPAAFGTVTAVGAGFGEYHASFSNFGDWVDRYRDGVDVLSVLPPDRWARWSGTSFAAANFAGDLARPQVV